MGKSTINTKAQEGRERKALKEAEKKQQIELKKQKIEDLEWEQGAKDLSKKEELEKKKQEKLDKKKQLKELASKEEEYLASVYAKPVLRSSKSTNKEESITSKTNKCTCLGNCKCTSQLSQQLDLELPITTNQQVFSASTIDDALFLLKSESSSVPSAGKIERHPERRIKAAYKQYEDVELPKVREENPHLKLSQLKEILAKNWKKSPMNPFNQEFVGYDASKQEEKTFAASQTNKKLEKLKL